MGGTDFFLVKLVLVLLCSGGLAALIYPFWIDFLKKRALASKGHVDHIIDIETKHLKERTPSFGGVVFMGVTLIGILICAGATLEGFASLFLGLGLFLVGLWDDLYKLWHRDSGISAKAKSLGQIGVSAIFLSLFVMQLPAHTPLYWMVYLPFLLFILVGTSNAVNLTDGMDGLAASLSIVSYGFLMSLALWEGKTELACMIAVVIGPLIAFLWFNRQPARIFMGDVGSLPLGGLLAGFAIFLGKELLLAFFGGMFVIETLSVIIQVAYYKRTKKRIFACAPLHHHYQSQGISEMGIVQRFCGCQLLLALLGIFAYWLGFNA